jgi:hypothetical protein
MVETTPEEDGGGGEEQAQKDRDRMLRTPQNLTPTPTDGKFEK